MNSKTFSAFLMLAIAFQPSAKVLGLDLKAAAESTLKNETTELLATEKETEKSCDDPHKHGGDHGCPD